VTRKLSLATLDAVVNAISKPNYDRTDLTPGVVHIGVGNFHRAHLGIYLHRLFEMGIDRDWAIVGAGITDADRVMRARLKSQDFLTTVVELDPKGYCATISGSMIDFVAIEPSLVIDRLVSPATRIASLTVTEGGYYMDAADGSFNANHPDIVADAANPDAPRTVFGILVAALKKRRDAGIAPFSVLSCDNVPNNGDVAKQAVLALAASHADDTRDWIAENVAFPNSMVDCITPATSDRERAMVQETFGIEDAVPVVCEPFRQWVLEDEFSNGRPALEKVGVQFTANVAAYELMKLRILNGGHASIAYPAALLDIHYVHDAMRNSTIAGFLDCLENNEIIPTVPEIAGVDFAAYYAKIVERFSNEAIGDTIPRLCIDGVSRQPKFILPVIEARLAAGQSVDGLALESALWCRYCYGVTDSGKDIVTDDADWLRLNTQAKLAKTDPLKWLEMSDVYGAVKSSEEFTKAFSTSLGALWRDGTKTTLDAWCSSFH